MYQTKILLLILGVCCAPTTATDGVFIEVCTLIYPLSSQHNHVGAHLLQGIWKSSNAVHLFGVAAPNTKMTAAEAVFATFELLEAILISVPPLDIFLSIAVSRT